MTREAARNSYALRKDLEWEHQSRGLTDWWVRGSFFTCWVRVEDGVIVDTAPILRRFRGQPFKNLLDWSPVQETRRLNMLDDPK